MIEIYTDGALRRRQKLIGAWCYFILMPDTSLTKAKVETASTITNNRMELTAVINAFKACPPNSQITLYTDSQYVVYGINNGNTKTNTDLWTTYTKVITNLKLDVTVKHVYGHQDDIGNNVVDLTMRHMIDLILKQKE